jgi:hypothetical protein
MLSAAALAVAAATPAAAQSTSSTPPPATCYGNACTPTPTPPTNPTPPPPPATCYGNACTTPSTFGVSGEALFGGLGHSVFQGTEGFNLVEKAGEGGVDIVIAGQGGLCSFNCADGNVTFRGFANETVRVNTGAIGSTSGTAVSAINQGGAAAMLRFSFQSGPAPAQVQHTPAAGK